MLLLPQKAFWIMQNSRFLSLVRTHTTLTPKLINTAPSTSFLQLDSYCEINANNRIYSNNRKINDFIKSGLLQSALHMFDEMTERDVVTYNLLISGHGRHGLPRQALNFYTEMVWNSIRESASTFSSVLGICNDMGFYQVGIQVHCRVILFGFGLNLFVGGALADLYMHMELEDVALKVFDEMPEQNLAMWNLVLRGLCELGRLDELLGLYKKMRLENVEPNGLSLCYLVRGCSTKKFLDEGKQMHCNVIKLGWVELNLFVANALVDFYSACGSLIDAKKSFEDIPAEDVISWNSIVSIYADHGFLLEAVELFYRMQFLGKKPSIRSFVGFLNLSSRTKSIRFGKQIHCYVTKLGFDHGSVHVQSALIDMYGKNGEIESSVLIFGSVPERTLEGCNSLMTSLLHCGAIEDVFEMFGLMVDEGIGLDEVTFSTTLKALSVSALTSLESISLLHCCAIKSGFESDVSVSCSLMDAYSRCGHVEFSNQVFSELPSPNVVCLTSIINSYARNGMGREGIQMLEKMILNGLKPDKVTFLCVLTGCSHSGLVKEGRLIFEYMKTVYGIEPNRQHFSCMVDLLGRAGFLEEAEDLLLRQAPGNGDCVMWSSLLQSCWIHNNEIVGRRAAKRLMELDPEDPAICLQVSNFYSEIGEFERSMHIREVAMARKVTREIGHSLIEVNCPVKH